MSEHSLVPHPPTIIVVHPKENRRKCSVEPLRGRPEFKFLPFHPSKPIEISGYIRLGVDGPPLSPKDSQFGLLVLDATWRHVVKMDQHYVHVPVRSLSGWTTAYPRVSKFFVDPAGGLATIEAIFAAHVILGRSTAGLLDHYRWREEFLGLNKERLS